MVWGPSFFGLIFLNFAILLSSSIVFSKDNFSDKNFKAVKLLVHNVGGSDFILGPTGGVHSVCPAFKLCHPDIMERVRSQIRDQEPEIIMFQEVQSKAQVLIGSPTEKPLVPAVFDAECAIASGNVEEVCISWNRNKVQLKKACEVLQLPESGAIKCTFDIMGTTIDFINVHPSVFDTASREQLLNKVWNELVTKGSKTIVGGDFNTEYGTYPSSLKSGLNKENPYPPEFGTVFGRSVKKYGRWEEKESFYGYRKLTEKAEWVIKKVFGSTIIHRKLDHVFANFGNVKSSKIIEMMPCKNSVCFGNEPDYEWSPFNFSFSSPFGAKTDHLPILSTLVW